MTAHAWSVLIRREFWEHRVLWLAPLIVCGLYLLLCLVPGGVHHGLGPRVTGDASHGSALLFMSLQLAFTGILFGLMSIVLFFYLAECLYSERKDRSILFWKSLPVSDGATVLSKLLVALLVLPLGLYVLSGVTNLLAFGILSARFRNDLAFGPYTHWDTLAWLRLNALLLGDVLVLALWYAPLAAYQLLVSAWARTSVLVWTVLPPIILVLAERMVFGTSHIGSIIGQRLGVGLSTLARSAAFGSGSQPSLGGDGMLERIDMFGLLATPELWIGVGVAALFVYAAIRIRRYRDDT